MFIAAALFAACGGAAANKPAAGNANATNANAVSQLVAVAPSKEDLIANETKAWKSWKAKDG